jgi:anion-transporting  ArsA/GET3 family ATPase
MSKSNIALTVIGTIALILILMFAIPPYSVWQQGKAGEARLKRAGQERQIIKERAKAELDAAKDTAQSIEIVGAAAKKYPEYRHQEFMSAFGDALTAEDSPIKLILVPTEANIPILVSKDMIED